MCTTNDSHPPIEPISGAAIDAQSSSLKGEDGAEFRVYHASPEQGTGAGIVILPDVRGLHPFFEELAMRFAERGISALAIDYFGRTAGAEPRGEDFDHKPHFEQARWEHLAGDIRTAVTHLRGFEPPTRSMFTTGFCMGGRLSSVSATLELGLAGVIPFYGWPVGPNRNGTPAPVDLTGRFECDVLAFYGGADEGIPEEARQQYDRALDAAGVRHETVVYPNAPHGFFDKKAAQFQKESADAWDRSLAFIRRHTAGQPTAATMRAPATVAGDTAVVEEDGRGAQRRVAPEPIDPRVEAFRDDD